MGGGRGEGGSSGTNFFFVSFTVSESMNGICPMQKQHGRPVTCLRPLVCIFTCIKHLSTDLSPVGSHARVADAHNSLSIGQSMTSSVNQHLLTPVCVCAIQPLSKETQLGDNDWFTILCLRPSDNHCNTSSFPILENVWHSSLK